MASTVLLGPLPSPLPPVADPSYFNTTQWAVFMALVEAVVPPVVPETRLTNKAHQLRISNDQHEDAFKKASALAVPPTKPELDAYLSESVMENPEFIDLTYRMMGALPIPLKKQLARAMGLLATKIGAYILTGTCIPVHEQPLHKREAFLRSWRVSWFQTPRLLFKSVTLIARVLWTRTSPQFLSLSGYPAVPENWKNVPSFPFKFIQIPHSKDDTPAVIETDVLIVGSGCGGGAVARHLANDCQLGDKVLVVDKGYFFKNDRFPMDQVAGLQHLYENNGFVMSDDSSVSALAGSCWGGGGTINWSVMLQLQDYVRKEWASQGLPLFASQELQDAFDHIFQVSGALTARRHNPQSNVILEGSKKLGWEADETPLNNGGKEHYCGQCHLGCSSGEKQGPSNRWLPDAAKVGARCMEGFEVGKILFEGSGADRAATGVIGIWTSRDSNGELAGALGHRVVRPVHIKAKKVVLSCGSLWSPVILKKSGLTNPNIGTNLHIHPCQQILGTWPEDRKPWEGGILTSVCKKLENLDGKGHGAKIEGSCMVPYAALSGLPWTSALNFKLDALKYRQQSLFITLTRDRDSGTVWPDPTTGKPRMLYTPSAFDMSHTLQAVVATAKLCYVTGATEICPYMNGLEPFVRTLEEVEAYTVAHKHNEVMPDPEDEDPRFKAWIGRIKEVGNAPPLASLLSAHQMGTCRMSSTEADGAVDPQGRVWGTRGLYVADASVFPSASGVNPMATTLAISHCIAKGIADEIKNSK
ncbi:long chain fatty alcohol oxidase [Zalerion maritima]|uniref:Long-chain-alcohol oxidase n=1 Tax=Zalerion maritima TaxID=339359 RepID=A0AAD5RFG9_9PEZI|nr:long chain fatty alcohol oxidase [Zalerion maritima]